MEQRRRLHALRLSASTHSLGVNLASAALGFVDLGEHGAAAALAAVLVSRGAAALLGRGARGAWGSGAGGGRSVRPKAPLPCPSGPQVQTHPQRAPL